MRYGIWILDLDGTAADTVESIANTANKVLAEFALPPQPTAYYKNFAGDGQFVLIQRALKSAGDRELAYYDRVMARYIEEFRTGCTYHVKPYAGLREVLQEVKNMGIKLAILSNKRHNNVLTVVGAAYGNDFFDCVVGQQDDIPKKPAPDGIYYILDKFGMEPEQCLYIGDTNVDMQTGNNAGCDTLGVTWGFRDRHELESNNATYIIDEPKGLLQFI